MERKAPIHSVVASAPADRTKTSNKRGDSQKIHQNVQRVSKEAWFTLDASCVASLGELSLRRSLRLCKGQLVTQ